MKLSEILESWKKDAVMDEVKLDKHSLETPQLHHKYLKMLMGEKARLRKYNAMRKTLTGVLFEYYRGHLLQEDLDEMGREQFLQKIMKQDIPMWIDRDGEMVNLRMDISICEEKIEALNSILDQLNRRSFHINNAINWNKLIGGGQ